jgi:anti-sigma factor RsiW
MSDRCRRFKTLIVSLADGELDLQGRAELEAHLVGCEACRRAAARIGTAPVDFGRIQVPGPVLETMRLELHERLDEIDGRRELSGRWWERLFTGSFQVPKPLAWAAVAVLLAVGTGELRMALRREPAAPPAIVIMDGLDRAAPSAGWSQV